MEYIIRTKTGFAISDNRKNAILKLVRSDQGDGGWSLHSLDGDADDYLLSGTAEETTFRDSQTGWQTGWDKPDVQDVRAALALEFVDTVATSAAEDDGGWAKEAGDLTEAPKTGLLRYV